MNPADMENETLLIAFTSIEGLLNSVTVEDVLCENFDEIVRRSKEFRSEILKRMTGQ